MTLDLFDLEPLFIPRGNLKNFLFFQSFLAQIYDRLQTQTASVLVPLDFFVVEKSIAEPAAANNADMHVSQYGSPNVMLVHEQTSETWINVRNTAFNLKF